MIRIDKGPSPQGTIDKELIRRVMRPILPKLQYCYEHELLGDPTLQGAVFVEFTIDSRGTVPKATATGLNATMAACLVTVLETMQFPAPPNGGLVTVRYPFTFKSTP